MSLLSEIEDAFEHTKTRTTTYGFVWGPIEVWRIMTYRGRRLLGIDTPRHKIEIVVSPKGNNVQIWHNGERVV